MVNRLVVHIRYMKKKKKLERCRISSSSSRSKRKRRREKNEKSSMEKFWKMDTGLITCSIKVLKVNFRCRLLLNLLLAISYFQRPN